MVFVKLKISDLDVHLPLGKTQEMLSLLFFFLASKMFHASLLYLPVFMSGIMFHRIVDNQQSLSEENLESSVELSLSSQDGNVNRKRRLRNSTDGTQVRPPVSYASIAPFPFLPVPSYADP